MVPATMLRYRYAVDEHDVIMSVSSVWLAFARENGAPELTEGAVIGRSLWDFIEGSSTIRLYEGVLQRVRTSVPRVVLPFRCDSPTLRRYMRLEMTSQSENGIQFEGVLERVEPTNWLKVLDPRALRSHNVLTLCSCCRRALVEPTGWLEIEDAAARLHLFEEEKSPQIRHTVCPNCLTATKAMPVTYNQNSSPEANVI